MRVLLVMVGAMLLLTACESEVPFGRGVIIFKSGVSITCDEVVKKYALEETYVVCVEKDGSTKYRSYDVSSIKRLR